MVINEYTKQAKVGKKNLLYPIKIDTLLAEDQCEPAWN